MNCTELWSQAGVVVMIVATLVIAVCALIVFTKWYET